ncbi:transducin-like enhancer protein 4, partial [Salvelinus fontinalis]|uniref:transducin-like enhancer protein 4 n=1 Tax=Salvelinus fontinalis TaxID=8038 RepID=UPI00248575AE
PHQPGQPFKFTVSESCDRIKEEFQFLQAQFHSLKLECEKLSSEKTEMQRHYVMYYEMSYGLNIEMHKQAEMVKRLNTICAQVIPFLSLEHQQQVVQAVERAKQVTMSELNSIIGQQQLHAQHLCHGPALPVPLTTQPSGHQPPQPALPTAGSSSLLALSSALAAHQMPLKEDKKQKDNNTDRERDSVKSPPVSPSSSFRAVEKHRSSGDSSDSKKQKMAEKELSATRNDSDGEKSDDSLVVDVSNEDPASPRGSPTHSPRENRLDKSRLLKKEVLPLSPASMASSSSTPSSKSKDLIMNEKSSTLTPTPSSTSTPTPRSTSTPGLRGKMSGLEGETH